MTVPTARAEQARALMLELFPQGFEELDGADGVELAAYTDPGGEERIWHAFGSAEAADVAEDWLDRWRRFHRPVRVGSVWVGPPWEEQPPDAFAVVIDPGRAFGTGGHPTTRLCLELLQELPPGSLVDVGCGSGVLAIAACGLGFGPVTALDSDANAVSATRGNAAANDADVDVRLADAVAAPLPRTDVGVVNISRPTIEALGPRLRSTLVVTSGYLSAERPELEGHEHRARVERDGWAADVFGRV